MKKRIVNNVYWVGKNDWELRQFHGYEYSTHKGSSYNSYLIQEEKTVLIDTVFQPFSKEFIDNLAKEIDLKSIDYIIMNHAEPDHSGAISELLRLIPGTPVYCTENGVKSLKGQFHGEWNFKTVKTGDKLDLGNGKELIFIQAPMLHWPDSMFCYMTKDNILFSNDAFGQHFCTELLFNDLVNQSELYQEAIKYYANILTPFSPLVLKKIDEVLKFNLPVDFICPSHGVVWRDNPAQIIHKYVEWASAYKENQITIVYETMYNGTRSIGESIVKGINSEDQVVDIKLYNIATNDLNDIITEIFKSKAVFIGSPTVNNGIMSHTAGLLEMVKGLKFKGKKGAAFGCFGWSDASTKIIMNLLKESGFEIVGESISCNWGPDEDAMQRAFDFGRSVVSKSE
ncbi:MAG: anaerobic nitric oxide reductase flavorubredoxin [Bacteroidales bacterium]|jgi:anaerobic nitric oxide reductase flavorubredoxin|nr:anaerobic nitric oxide reductase flavorubredoxin [Bacteroidales bacterium]MBP8678432.1 anaerobic nitric oxide reductase flavorubredoxin [Bacteroidales bacterium]